jgi:hypothetical protein
VSRNFDKAMADGEIVAGESVFLGSENESDAATAGEFRVDDGRKGWKRDDWLLRLTMRKCPSAEDESAIGDGVG